MPRRGRPPKYRTLPAHPNLVTWGRWTRSGCSPGIGYKSKAAFVQEAAGSHLSEFDEEVVGQVQEIMSRLWADGHNREMHDAFRRKTLQLYWFIIKIEYTESHYTREQQAGHVRKRFGMNRYSERQLIDHLTSAVAYMGMELGLTKSD